MSDPEQRKLTEVDVLERALGLAKQYGHAKGVSATDAEGQRVDASSAQATAFCVTGLLWRAYCELVGDKTPERFVLSRPSSRKKRLPFEVACMFVFLEFDSPVATLKWNDLPETTQQDVIALLERTLEKARAEAAC